jgi:hypothetical protein
MQDAGSFLKKRLRSARNSIVIATPSLQYRALSNAVADAAERGIPVTLITSEEPGDARGLVRYANVRLLILKGLQGDDFDGRLKATLLRVDGHTGCLGSLPLARRELAHSIGILECRDEPAAVKRYGAYLETMIKRSSPYLKP